MVGERRSWAVGLLVVAACGGDPAGSQTTAGNGSVTLGSEGGSDAEGEGTASASTTTATASTTATSDQHGYHVTNVREDGTIPAVQPKNWLTLNTFRTQSQIDAGGGVCVPEPRG